MIFGIVLSFKFRKSTPSIVIEPLVTSYSLNSSDISVLFVFNSITSCFNYLFPAPEWPTIAHTVPGRTSNEMFCNWKGANFSDNR